MMAAIAKLTDNFSETRIDDEIVVMRLDTGEFLSITGTGVSIWELVDGTRDRRALIAALCSEFEAPQADIEADVDEFVGKLRDAGLIAGG